MKYALAKEVLVGVGDGAGINIKATLAGVDRSKPRAHCRLNGNRDARLQDSKTRSDDAALGVDDGLIEGMGDGADQAGRSAAGKLRIAVERENVANAVEAPRSGQS